MEEDVQGGVVTRQELRSQGLNGGAGSRGGDSRGGTLCIFTLLDSSVMYSGTDLKQ